MQRYIWVFATITCLFITGSGSGCGSSSPTGQDMTVTGGKDMRVFVRDLTCSANDLAISGDLATRLTTDQACSMYASQFCSRLQTCHPFSLKTTYQDLAQCQARIQLACDLSAPLNGSSQSDANITTCATALTTVSCPDFLSGYNFLPAACRMVGTLANGTACGDDHQCSSGYCKLTTQSNCGQCATKSPVGATCVTESDCNFGLTCFGQGTARKCITPAAQGGVCNATDKTCKHGLFCIAGQCAAGQPVGSACILGGQTCDALTGLYCDTQTAKCVATTVAAVNQACGFINNIKVQCAGGADCYSVGQARQCVAAAADGAVCSLGATTGGPGCLAQARCSAGPACTTLCLVPNPGVCR